MTREATSRKIRTEAASAGKFAIVGIAATLTHAGIAASLLESGTLSAMSSNVVGFLIAFCVSFGGHYFWSFSHLRENSSALRSMLRFLMIALAGFAINSTVLTLWLRLTPWPDLVGLLFSIGIVPALTFLGARLWAFSHNPVET
ncbi:MAG: GtrA family protein [Roseibium sp.]